jgi:hypothetical protein
MGEQAADIYSTPSSYTSRCSGLTLQNYPPDLPTKKAIPPGTKADRVGAGQQKIIIFQLTLQLSYLQV